MKLAVKLFILPAIALMVATVPATAVELTDVDPPQIEFPEQVERFYWRSWDRSPKRN